jgi:glycosyltransferase involved in cell wall biosynthesis
MGKMYYICKEWPNKYKPTWDWQIRELHKAGYDITVIQTHKRCSSKKLIPNTDREVNYLWYPSTLRDVFNLRDLFNLFFSFRWLSFKRLKCLFVKTPFKNRVLYFVRSLYLPSQEPCSVFLKNLSTSHDFFFINKFYPHSTLFMYYHGAATAGVEPTYLETCGRAFKWLKVIFTNTQYSKGTLFDLGCEPEKIKVLPVGFDLEEFPEPDRQYFKHERQNLLTVSRVSKEKGLIYVLMALRDLVAGGMDKIFLDVVGEGEELNELREFVSENNLEEYVVFHGYQPNTQVRRTFLPQADLLINAAIPIGLCQENQCIAVQEANLLKVPALVTKIGGLPEVVFDGVNGYVVPHSDVDSICASIRAHASLTEFEAKAFGASSRKFVAEKFDVEKMTATILSTVTS